jgi:hypothetical protein
MKPTADELQQALAEAERLREADADVHHLAKTILYQHERLQHLEAVRRLAERLINFGQDEHEHALLVKALDAARHAEERAGDAGEEFGLA